MIEVKDLVKTYNTADVVNIPHITIQQGESFGLVGNNGAGKTTFFRMILDLIKPSHGTVFNTGTDVSQTEEWKKTTGSYLDENFLIDFLTPEEYFYFIGSLHGMNKADVNAVLDGMTDFFNDEIMGKKKYIRDMSKGNQKKIGIAAAILFSPDVIILDEPFANLDPSTQIRLKKLLRELNDQNKTLLISSHDLNHVTEVCKRIVILHKGETVKDLQTTPDTLRELERYFEDQIALAGSQ